MFLLSESESLRYFASDTERKATPTAFAFAKGARLFDGFDLLYYEDGCSYSSEFSTDWWVRTPAAFDGESFTSIVSIYGETGNYESESSSYNSVRPALWVKNEVLNG